MKTHLIILLVSIMGVLLLLGCNKENETSQKDSCLLIDTTGNYAFAGNIDTTIYVQSIGPFESSIKLDLNKDMTDDIEFYCSAYLHTVYREWSAAVRTLNPDLSLCVEADTTTIASFSIPLAIPPDDDTIIIYYNENYNPAKQYPSNLTTVNKVFMFPVVCSTGDTLDEFCNWQSGAFGLISGDYNQGQIQNNILYGTWRNIDKKFIALRFIENSVVYYGWIELGVMEYSITLYKYALSRKQ